VYEVQRNSPGNYAVVSIEYIDLVTRIPNHNDDGSLVDLGSERQITGITVVGTADNPVIYVTSSDRRRGQYNDEDGLNIDTNSGVISRITWMGTNRNDPMGAWEKVDLVRGLPRSAEYHATNGIQYDSINHRLFVASGGNTNMGAPDNFLSFVPEYALSAAILEVDLTAIDAMPIQDPVGLNPYIYDLPTLTSGNDSNDPFGGQRGANQARIVEGGPVQIYSPGYRNSYDLVLTQDGLLYATDNGPNSGFGRFLKDEADRINLGTGLPYGSGACTDEPANGSFPASFTGDDQLHLVTEGFYAGHPAPVRGNRNNQYNDQSPVPATYDGSQECDFIWSGDAPDNLPEDGALATFGGSTNGITEYTASNFAGQMQSDLLLASYAEDNSLYRVGLSDDGLTATSNNVLFSFAGTPLDVVAQGDFDVFPGTVWVTSIYPSDVIVFEPGDYGGIDVGACDTSVGTQDSDGDGFSNDDETLNNTSPCNAAHFPPDNDGDKVSDLLDADDDNDGIADVNDLFQIDAFNGRTSDLPIIFDYDPGGTNFGGGIANAGFDGMMIQPDTGTDYLTLFDPTDMTVGGIIAAFVIDNVPAGTALGAVNTQSYAFHKGINVDSMTGQVTIRSRLTSPFFSGDAKPGQEIGIYLGTGDQDNYLKLVINSTGFLVVEEVAGSITMVQTEASVLDSTYIDLIFTIDTTKATVQPRYAADNNFIVDLPMVTLRDGTLKAALQSVSQAPAVGFIATDNGAGTFAGVWDSLEIIANCDRIAPTVAESDVELFAPQHIGVLPNQGRPTIVWDNDENADWYNIWIGDANGQILYDWFPKRGGALDTDDAPDKAECAGLTCTFQPHINPSAGTYTVWMQAWGTKEGTLAGGMLSNIGGNGAAVGAPGWNSSATFTYPAIRPGAVLPLTTTVNDERDVTLTWAAAHYASWYNVWIGTSEPDWQQSFSGWMTAEALGCQNTPACTLDSTTPVYLPSGNLQLESGEYVWYIQSWGPGGFSQGGQYDGELEAWQLGGMFTVP